MKKIYVILVGVVLGLVFNIHAQTAVVGSLNNGLTPIQSATPDSIVQVTADAQGLAQIAPADLPRTGTYWLVMPGGVPVPAPCPPLDPGVPVYQMASGQFLVDATGGKVAVNPRRFGLRAQATGDTTASALEAQANTVVSLISQVQTAAANQQMLAMGLDVPSPGGGSSSTNGFYSDSFNYTHPTNGLWLEMNGITNRQVYITAHNVMADYFELLSKTNLSDKAWEAEQLFQTVTNSELPLAPVAELNPGATNSSMFFWGKQSDALIGVNAYGNSIRPSPGFAAISGIFQINLEDADGSYNTNLVVHFSMSGTAVYGVDYVISDPSTGALLTNNSITILAGNLVAKVEVDPLTNVLCVSNLTVTLTLEDDPNYLVDYDNYDYMGWSSDTNNIAPNVFSIIATSGTVPGPCGMDYHPPTQSLIVSSKSNNVWSFKRIDASGNVTPWSSVQMSMPNEVKLATVKTTANGFTNGAMYFDSSENGTIGWISPDGTTNGNFFTSSGRKFWGLYIDQSGSFGTNLIALQDNVPGDGGVWQINASGATVANYPSASGIEGVISLTNDINKYGPLLAGKIITGIDAISTNGVVTPALGLLAEDCDIIQSNQNLYCADDDDGYVLEVPKELFVGHEGDVLITDSGFYDLTPGLFIVHWDTNTADFVITQIPMPGNNISAFEHVTFAPMDIPPVSQ